jgi:hypothetical protein
MARQPGSTKAHINITCTTYETTADLIVTPEQFRVLQRLQQRVNASADQFSPIISTITYKGQEYRA